MPLKTGDKLTVTTTVTQEMLASTVKSGSLNVLATPCVVALMEQAATTLAQNGLEDIYTTVGTAISIEHISPTPINAEISATAELCQQEGRMFTFNVTASDKAGIIAKGSHTRVSVKCESFQRKADEKFNG